MQPKTTMKLKPIPSNTVVHTPTEAEAKELLAILHENGWVVREPLDYVISKAKGVSIYPKPNWGWWEDINNAKLNDDTILTLAEFKEQYIDFDDTFTDDCKRSVKVEKELNLCELLKGHEGEEFFSPISNNPLKLKAVFGRSLTFFLDEEDDLTVDFDGSGRISIPSLNGDSQLKYITDLKSQCLIFPSRAHYEQYPLDPYTAWMKWQEEQEVKCRIWVSVETKGAGSMPVNYYDMIFRNLAARDKCIEEIKEIIEKYKQ